MTSEISLLRSSILPPATNFYSCGPAVFEFMSIGAGSGHYFIGQVPRRKFIPVC